MSNDVSHLVSWNRACLQGEDLLKVDMLLREDPDGEVAVLVGLEGGREDEVLPGREAEAVAHLSQVDEGLRAGLGGIAQEEALIQMNLSPPCVLEDRKKIYIQTATRGDHHFSYRTCFLFCGSAGYVQWHLSIPADEV